MKGKVVFFIYNSAIATKMTLQSLMQNPLAWLILSICSIAAFLFAIVTWLIGRNKKNICFRKHSYNLIKNGKTLLPDLVVQYKHKSILDLSITRFAIWNGGNDVINCDDVVISKPLTIYSSNENTVLLNTNIITQSDETNNFVLREASEKQSIIDFDYVNPKEGVVIQLIHTGSINNIVFSCKIKGGKEIKRENKPRKPRKIDRKALTSIIIIGTLLITILTLLVDASVLGIIPREIARILLETKQDGSIIVPMVVMLNISTIITLFLTYLWADMVFNLYIPSKLRKDYNFER